MYKNTLSVLAFTASLGVAMAQDAPAPTPAPAPAPATETVAADEAAAVIEGEGAISPEKIAKIQKQMGEFEVAIQEAGLDQVSGVPTAEQIKALAGIIDSFLARTDLEEECLAQFFEMKVMMSILYAESAADLEKLKTDLEKLIPAYPASADDMQQYIAQIFANGAEALFTETQPMRDEMAEAIAAAAAAPAEEPAEEPAPAPAQEAAPEPAPAQ